MVMCSTCQHQEVVGALFCSECGAQLQMVGALATQNIHTPEVYDNAFDKIPVKREVVSSVDAMTLQILDGGQLLSLEERQEFTIGRVSDGQTIMPDIDLTSYGGYEGGVSRLHAVLKKSKDGVTIMDLGSSNGTYVNGTRLKPENESYLSHGSVISLGKLKLQFLLQG